MITVTFLRTGNKHVSLAPNCTFMTEGLEGMDIERIASTWTRSCATACTNCLPSLFNAFVILQCASCQPDLLDQAFTSVALALGAYPLLRRSIGMDCSKKITSQTLCASELPPGRAMFRDTLKILATLFRQRNKCA